MAMATDTGDAAIPIQPRVRTLPEPLNYQT